MGTELFRQEQKPERRLHASPHGRMPHQGLPPAQHLLPRARCGSTAGQAQPTDRKTRPMAVQQNKKSPSKRGMHRSHNAVAAPGTGLEPTTGEVHLRHHISPTGFYRGRKVIKTKSDAA